MTRTTALTDFRQRLRISASASALGLVVRAVAATPAAAAPTAKAGVADGTLRIAGGPLAEQITLRLSAVDRNQLQVDLGDDGSADFTFDLGTFRAIEVAAGNRDDTVRIDQVNGAFTTTKPTRIDGENGDDTLIGGSRGPRSSSATGATTSSTATEAPIPRSSARATTPSSGTRATVPMSSTVVVARTRWPSTDPAAARSWPRRPSEAACRSRGTWAQSSWTSMTSRRSTSRPLGGTDTVTVNDVGATDLERVDVDLAAALGGSIADGKADTVTVAGTKGDDSIATDTNGAAVEVSGLAASVRISHADPASDTLVIDTVAGTDDVSIDPALSATAPSMAARRTSQGWPDSDRPDRSEAGQSTVRVTSLGRRSVARSR